MKVTIQLSSTPATGSELVELLIRAAGNINYNIGPEPLRATTGPIYDADREPMERIGTWAVELGVGSQPHSELFERLDDIFRLAPGHPVHGGFLTRRIRSLREEER